MTRLILLALATGIITGCMTVNITTGSGSCAPITVQLEKPISTLPLQARDVTVPMSAIP